MDSSNKRLDAVDALALDFISSNTIYLEDESPRNAICHAVEIIPLPSAGDEMKKLVILAIFVVMNVYIYNTFFISIYLE